MQGIFINIIVGTLSILIIRKLVLGTLRGDLINAKSLIFLQSLAILGFILAFTLNSTILQLTISTKSNYVFIYPVLLIVGLFLSFLKKRKLWAISAYLTGIYFWITFWFLLMKNDALIHSIEIVPWGFGFLIVLLIFTFDFIPATQILSANSIRKSLNKDSNKKIKKYLNKK